MAVLNYLKEKLFSGHERSVRAKKNIFGLFFARGYSVLVNLALIPITLHILGSYEYGVWITIFNVLSWIQIFDIGIGNGLRNKYTEAIAYKDFKSAKEYVSTAYFIMSSISITLVVIFILPWHLVNWAEVFGTKSALNYELRYLVGIAFSLTAIQFTFKLINTILTADHKPSWAGFIMAISNTIILVVFLTLNKFFKESLVGVGLVYTITPLTVFFIASLILFNSTFKKIKPSLRSFDRGKIKDLFSLGSQFFIIQIAVLVIFQTDALIISHVLSPKEVTPYNIVFRYFGIVTMFVGIIMTPFWSAYTEANSKKDFVWMRDTIFNQLKGLILIVGVVILLAVLTSPVIKLWINQKLIISNALILGMALYTIIAVWNNIFSFFLNGLSRTKVQIITSIIGLTINIPLSIYLAKYFGSGGVIMATCVSLSFFAVFGAIDSFRFLKNNS